MWNIDFSNVSVAAVNAAAAAQQQEEKNTIAKNLTNVVSTKNNPSVGGTNQDATTTSTSTSATSTSNLLAPFSLQRINQLERALLACLHFRTAIPASVYAKYYFLLRNMLIRSGLLSPHNNNHSTHINNSTGTTNTNTTTSNTNSTMSSLTQQQQRVSETLLSMGQPITASMNQQQQQQHRREFAKSIDWSCLQQRQQLLLPSSLSAQTKDPIAGTTNRNTMKNDIPTTMSSTSHDHEGADIIASSINSNNNTATTISTPSITSSRSHQLTTIATTPTSSSSAELPFLSSSRNGSPVGGNSINSNTCPSPVVFLKDVPVPGCLETMEIVTAI